jgi:hypothetical protein
MIMKRINIRKKEKEQIWIKVNGEKSSYYEKNKHCKIDEITSIYTTINKFRKRTNMNTNKINGEKLSSA